MAAVRQEITFENLDGKTVTEEWWFQLGQTDALEMDMVHEFAGDPDPEKRFKDIVDGNDTRTFVRLWKDLIFAAVARREGNSLVKDPEVLKQFRYGGAYEQFFSDLLESEDAGAKFFASIMPESSQKADSVKKDATYSDEQLLAMSDDEFYTVVGTSDIRKMAKPHMMLAMRRINNKAA